MLVIDAANVVGAVPDGWWRDRPGAAVRLIARLRAAIAAGLLPDDTVVLVLEGAARGALPPGAADGIEIRHAAGDGDEEVRRAVADASGVVVRVVTADRQLAADCVAAGAEVVGPRWLLDRLP